ncbi:MAG: amidase family protein [Gammaproteobacteria bacterium]
MDARHYPALDGLALAAAIRRGELDPHALLAAVYARCEAFDPLLKVLALRTEAIAEASLNRLDRTAPFAGVPLLMKDLGAALAGAPSHCGSRYLERRAQPERADADLTRRFKQAGFIIAGKSRVPEFGLNLATERSGGPATRNPWNLALTPGGSSGGAAAAVASGIVPIAHATDAGGSIRVPAACCGLVGLKPGRGSVPGGPLFGNHLFGLAAEHVLTRTVRDSAAVLDCTFGHARGPYPEPTMAGAPERLNIGLILAAGADWPVAADYRRAVERAAGVFEQAGQPVELLAGPGVEEEIVAAAEVFSVVIAANLAHEFAGVDLEQAELEPITRATIRKGKTLSATALIAAERRLLQVAYRLGEWFERYDALLLPALATPPPPIGALPMDHEDVLGHFARMTAFAPFAALFNVSGHPAISVPHGQTAGGLPLAVQIAAPFGGEARLLALAAQLEQRAPWPLIAPMVGVAP